MNTVSLTLKVLETDELLASVTSFLQKNVILQSEQAIQYVKLITDVTHLKQKQITYVSKSFIQQTVLLCYGTIHI